MALNLASALEAELSCLGDAPEALGDRYEEPARDAEPPQRSAPAKRRKAAKPVGSAAVADSAATVASVAAAPTKGEEEPETVAKTGAKRRRKAPAEGPAGADDGVQEQVGSDSAVGGEAAEAPRTSATHRTAESFNALGLKRWIVENCEKLGMQNPTEIQSMSIPPALAGKNVAGNSKTGTGKTACYCLPILHKLSEDPFGVFALVLTPVRELAFQVADNFRALGRSIGVTVAEIVGGREMMAQSKMIAERRHVIVATPGRLADLLRGDPDLARAFSLLRVFVLDEADQLLTQTFEEPLAEIGALMPKKRQTLLFSATLTSSIDKLKAIVPGLVLADSNPADESLEALTQEYVFVPKTVQLCYLHYLLKEHFEGTSCIVFTPRIEKCQLITTMLEFLGFPVTGLHALQTQRQRQACLGKFKAGRATILVATDVACRGLDIPKVAVVLNMGLPYTTDIYVHRSGRTARAGRTGLVVNLMSEDDVGGVPAIEKRIQKALVLRPTVEKEALALLSKTSKARQRAELLLSDVGFEEHAEEHRTARREAAKARSEGTKKAKAKKKTKTKTASTEEKDAAEP